MSLAKALSSNKPAYASTLQCGFCLKLGSLTDFGEYPLLVSESRKGPAFTPLKICQACTAIYNPITEVTGESNRSNQEQWLEARAEYKVPRGRGFKKDLFRHRDILDFILNDKEIDPSLLTYFEFGAGTGMLAASACELFSEVKVYDVVGHRLEKMRRKLNVPNLEVIGENELDSVRADFIVAWHVFEHLVAPGEVLNSVLEALSPTGVLYFQVPLISREFVFSTHLFFLNENAIRKVCENRPLHLSFFYDHSLAALTCLIQKIDEENRQG